MKGTSFYIQGIKQQQPVICLRRDNGGERRGREGYTATPPRMIVFFRTAAMTSGPTPPGTGVMRLAFLLALSKSTSPTTPPTPSLYPKSMTVLPTLIMSPVISPGLPTPDTTISA